MPNACVYRGHISAVRSSQPRVPLVLIWRKSKGTRMRSWIRIRIRFYYHGRGCFFIYVRSGSRRHQTTRRHARMRHSRQNRTSRSKVKVIYAKNHYFFDGVPNKKFIHRPIGLGKAPNDAPSHKDASESTKTPIEVKGQGHICKKRLFYFPVI